MSVKIHNLLVFSLPKIVVIFYMLKVLLPGCMIVLTTSLLYISMNNVMITSPSLILTLVYVDPVTRQIFNYTKQIPCENKPQNVVALDTDTDQYCVLTPQPIKKTLLY